LKAAGSSFIDLLLPEDEAEVIKFASGVAVIQGYTTDKAALKNAIAAPADPFAIANESIKLFDSLKRAVDDATNRVNLRRVVVVLSSNDDHGSTVIPDLDSTIDYAVKWDIFLFTISLSKGVFPWNNILQMQRLAAETGGEYSWAQSPDETFVRPIYEKIFDVLSNNFIITYTSSSAGDATVSIDVELFDNGVFQGGDSKEATG
jgi:hypothetical protein